MRSTRLEDATQNLSAATFLALDAVGRLDELTQYGAEHPLTGGDGRGDGITPTQICRTIDEARRMMLVARKELGCW